MDDLLHLALVASGQRGGAGHRAGLAVGDARFRRPDERQGGGARPRQHALRRPLRLDERNVSSPYDVARLIAAAMAEPALARIMAKGSYRFRTSRRRVAVRNTTRLVRERADVAGGKTGYIREAGYCLAAFVESRGGVPLAVVVLGARSNEERFAEVRASSTG